MGGLPRCFSYLDLEVTERVLEQITSWQARPLDAIYPIVYLDCIVIKIRENQTVINKSVYLALGVNMDGHKDLLGSWVSENEGAKFWLSVLTELKSLGVQDILIACVDGLKGFLKPLLLSILRPVFNCVSCICSGEA